MRKSLLVVLVVGLVVALGVTGCATKTYVQEQVAASAKVQDTKIGEVQKQVEATQMDVTNLKQSDATQNEQLAKLSDTAKEAMARAEEAGKLANHSFLYEVTLTDDAVHFGFNKSDLSADAKAALDAFAKKVKDENKNVYIEIQGNTDSVGSEQYNLTLGQARAEAVLRYLNMQDGFPLNRMSAISYGEYKPIDDNKTAAGRAKNRRVTLVVMN
jgi:peptidoglycan-associated lipoprotein